MSLSLIHYQMILVISSPSRSQTPPVTVIFSIPESTILNKNDSYFYLKILELRFWNLIINWFVKIELNFIF